MGNFGVFRAGAVAAFFNGAATHPARPPVVVAGRLRPFTVKDAGAVKAAGEDPDIVRYTFMPAAPSDEATVDIWSFSRLASD